MIGLASVLVALLQCILLLCLAYHYFLAVMSIRQPVPGLSFPSTDNENCRGGVFAKHPEQSERTPPSG